MKPYLILLGLLFLSFGSYAQNTSDAKIRAIKISLITDKMKLNADQATKFWPVYNQYESEMRVIWKAKGALKNERGMTAEEIIDERQKLDERTVSIKAKYKNEFLNIISAAQLNSLYLAESEFKNILINQLKK
ncbi:hypothetical protein DBR32_01455 [Taibaiella sp. KBW10]|uniref:hypothetical protein n=1 Tax=Taibaiella sp. KBW10 TaxID=2153357 RepID=UPI000F5A11EA|nr:hypothetical protein [Taibaiella sp. KBW10]RQO32304.1 hypothetical protein DBR32_01455 [Taibaiella sp. KBW10]